jgi:hypothetical protein
MKVQALLVAFGALSLSACAVEDKQPNCDKLERYIEGRERGLERSCRVDDDCKVVFIRPDRPIAASELPDDPELQRVLDAYYGRTAAALVEVPEGAVRPDTGAGSGSGAGAGSGVGSGTGAGSGSGTATGSDAGISDGGASDATTETLACLALPAPLQRRLIARCEPVIDEVPGEDTGVADTGTGSGSGAGSGSGSEVVVDDSGVAKVCVLRGETDGLFDPDGIGSGDEDASCACPSCGPLTVCADCACISTESVCGKACLAAASCGSLLEVGLGATAAACVSSCEAEIAANADVTTSAQCIATAACDAIPSCLVSSP